MVLFFLKHGRKIFFITIFSFIVAILYIQKDKTLKKILIALSVFLIGFNLGCSLLEVKDPQKQAEQTYKKSMSVKIDGEKYAGTGVLPIKSSYNITLIPKDKASRINIMNCHREIVIDKPKTGWFSKEYSFLFEPLMGVEFGKLCQLEIASLNENVKNSFAFFEFDDIRPEVSLKATVLCNGERLSSRSGVSLCQSAEGLSQQIYFNERVLIDGIDSSCEEPQTKDGHHWSFVSTNGKCSYYFVAQRRHENGKRLMHRLTAVGYSSIPVED